MVSWFGVSQYRTTHVHLASFASLEMISAARRISVHWLRFSPPAARPPVSHLPRRLASLRVGPSSLPVASVFSGPCVSFIHHSAAAVAEMGAGGSREEGGRRAKLTFKRSRRAAGEVASAQQSAGEPVLRTQQQEQAKEEEEVRANGGGEQKPEAAADPGQPGGQGGAGAEGEGSDDYVQAVVANASEFGENE